MTDQIVRTFTIEQQAQTALCASLKAAVKADYPAIRQHRTATKGAARNAEWQSTLSQMKAEARARLLVYGFVRGHDWARMEFNHPGGEGVRDLFKNWYLKRTWEQAVASVDESLRSAIVKPAALAKYVHGV